MECNLEFVAHQRKSDKRIQSVEEHLSQVALISKNLAQKISLPLCGEIIGLLHDLGKYSDEFQEYIQFCINNDTGNFDPDAEENLSWKKGKVDHSTAGAQNIYKTEISSNIGPYLQQILALCIASHHGGLIDCISPNGIDLFTMRMNKDVKKTHLDEVIVKCPIEISQHFSKLVNSEKILIELKAFLRKIPKDKKDLYLGFTTRMLFSCLLDADRTDTADFEYISNKNLRLNHTYPKWEEFISALEARLACFKSENRVDEIRTEVSYACKKAGTRNKGIFTLTVPTGGGKTLASLRFALEHAKKHNLDRVIYVIPYTSIIDQNVREVQSTFKELSEYYGVELVLEHHSNLTPEIESTSHRLMSENWDAPIVYTTSVQLLDSLFSGGTRGARRMHNLANSVIVFDEIQTLPVKTVHLFNNAMNFLVKICGSSIVLCTATQPLLHKVDSSKGNIQLTDQSEIISNVNQLFEELKRVEIFDQRKAGGWTELEIVKLIESELHFRGSVLVIVNTKKAAENLFKLCQCLNAKVFHLSTNQCSQHRIELIEKIRQLARPDSNEPIICISTQLIEAGVDVDFGSVIRYVAGLDSIAQAAGRCNRSGKRHCLGRVIVLNPHKENTSILIDIEKGKEVSERVLNEYKSTPHEFAHSLLSTLSIDRYFLYYFFNRSSEMSYNIETTVNDTLLRLLSTNERAVGIYNNSNLPLKQSFKTAGQLFEVISSKTQGVIVPYGDGERIIAELFASKDITKETKLLKLAQRYSVNCYSNMINSLLKANAIVPIKDSGLYALRVEHYSTDFGVSIEAQYEDINIDSYCL